MKMYKADLHIHTCLSPCAELDMSPIAVRLVDRTDHTLVIEVEDDGRGMDEETLKNAANPFYTTRNNKRYGLGLSLLSQACEDAGGSLKIEKGNPGGSFIFRTY